MVLSHALTYTFAPILKTAMIDKQLLSILVCPVTKTSLIYDKEANELVSTAASLAYPVRDGIPVMLESEARQVSAEEILDIKSRYKAP